MDPNQYSPDKLENYLDYYEFEDEYGKKYQEAHEKLLQENKELNVVNLNFAIEELGLPTTQDKARVERAEQYIEVWGRNNSVDELVIQPEEINELNEFLVGLIEETGREVTTQQDLMDPREPLNLKEIEGLLFTELDNKANEMFLIEKKQIMEANKMSGDDAHPIALDRLKIRTEYYLTMMDKMMRSGSIQELRSRLETRPINVNKFNMEMISKAQDESAAVIQSSPDTESYGVELPQTLPTPLDVPYLESFIQAVDMKQRYKQYSTGQADWLNPQQPILATAYGTEKDKDGNIIKGYPTPSQWMMDYAEVKNAFDERVGKVSEDKNVATGQAQTIVRQEIISEMPKYFVGIPGFAGIETKLAVPDILDYFGFVSDPGAVSPNDPREKTVTDESALEASMRLRGGFDAMSEEFNTQ